MQPLLPSDRLSSPLSPVVLWLSTLMVPCRDPSQDWLNLWIAESHMFLSPMSPLRPLMPMKGFTLQATATEGVGVSVWDILHFLA